jgi:outer membrane protein assembly factor BamB
MNRRTFLRAAGVGLGASALVGATGLNPLAAGPDAALRDDDRGGSSTPTPTPTPAPTQTPTPPHRLWSVDLFSDVWGFAVAGSELYLSVANDVYRLDAATGAETWRAASEQRLETPVAVGEATVLAVGRHGRAIGIDRATGDREWFENTHSFTPARPVIYGDTAVVPGDRVYGFDVRSGRGLWASETSFTAPNALGDGRFLYVGSAWNLAKIDCTDGTPVWTWADGERRHAPSYNFVLDADRGHLYGTYNWEFFAVDVESGAVVWRGEYDAIPGSVHRHDDLLVSAAETDAGNTKLVALDLDGPTVAWERIAPFDVDGWEYGRIATPLFEYDGQIVAGTTTGHLVTLAPSSGDLLGATRVFEDGVRGLSVHGNRAFATGRGTLSGIDLTEI